MDKFLINEGLRRIKQEMALMLDKNYTSVIGRAIDEMDSLVRRYKELNVTVDIPYLEMVQLNETDVINIAKQNLAEELAQYILDNGNFSIRDCKYTHNGKQLTASVGVIALADKPT